jgi:hypothetical protein
LQLADNSGDGIAVLMLGSTLYASISNMRAMEHMHADSQRTIDNVSVRQIIYLMTRNRVILMDAGDQFEPYVWNGAKQSL